jgi:hypothetical protein
LRVPVIGAADDIADAEAGGQEEDGRELQEIENGETTWFRHGKPREMS